MMFAMRCPAFRRWLTFEEGLLLYVQCGLQTVVLFRESVPHTHTLLDKNKITEVICWELNPLNHNQNRFLSLGI